MSRAGFRGDKKKHTGAGIMGPTRWAWVKVYFGELIITVMRDEDDKGKQIGPIKDIMLLHPIRNRQPVAWNLTALTAEELTAYRELFNTACDWALPICEQRDKEAQDALDNGDDSHSRIYRQVPQLVYRTRPEQQHREGILNGPANAADVAQALVNLGRGVRDASGDVAESDASGGSTQDDGS